MSTKTCKCHHCGKMLVRLVAPSIKTKLHFCDRKCKGEYQKTARPVSKEWLYEHYIVKGMDTTQIAHVVKRDPKSVWNWLKDFGIPTRRRGTTGNGDWKGKGRTHPGLGSKRSEEFRKKLSDHCKATGRVPYDPKVGSYMKGKKGSETPNWKGGHTPERQAFYGTPEWKKVEREVKKRDNRTCQRCGKKWARGDQFDVHHIVGFANKDLRCEASNLILLCEPCHYWVHGKENTNKEFIDGSSDGN